MSASFAPFERKMREAGLPDVAVRSFRAAFEALVAGETGMLSQRELEPVDAVADAASLGDLHGAGREALAQTVVIKLNGGLGTTMGMTRAKSLVHVKDGLSFLDVIARQIVHLHERHGVTVPLVLMNSFRTQRRLARRALAATASSRARLAPDFLQHKVPRIAATTSRPCAGRRSPSTSGARPATATSTRRCSAPASSTRCSRPVTELRLRLQRRQPRRRARPRPARLVRRVGRSVRDGGDERTHADRKGGHLARNRAGRLTLRETAQCPRTSARASRTSSLCRFFNTNNLWIHLPALRHALYETDGVLPLPLIRNEKPVDPEDPASPRVIQLETAMGAAIALFEGAQAVRVPDERFAPVKTAADLLRVRSDAYVRDEEQRVVPAPGGLGGAIAIDLDAKYFRTVADLEQRTPQGPPSLLRCRRLTVRGDVRFGRGVVIEGDVTLEAPPGGGLHVPDGTVLTG